MVPFLVVGALVLVVLWMAGKGEGGAAAQVAQSLPPSNMVPTGGVTATISPAMSGGQPLLFTENGLRLDVSAPTPGQPAYDEAAAGDAARVRAARAALLSDAVGPTNVQSTNMHTTEPAPVRTLDSLPLLSGGWSKI